jgi:hypothetical protein
MGKLLAAATMALLVGVSLGRAADIQLGNDGGRYVIFVSGDIVEGGRPALRGGCWEPYSGCSVFILLWFLITLSARADSQAGARVGKGH